MSKARLIQDLSGSPGGQALRNWRDDPTANWSPSPSDLNGAMQGRPIPLTTKNKRPGKPIPNANGLGGVNRGRRQT